MTKRRNKPHRRKETEPLSQARKTVSGRKKALIATMVVLCLGALGFFIARSFRDRELMPSEEKAQDKLVRAELDIEESAKAYNQRAIEVAQRLLEEFPGRPEPIFLLGRVHYEQENQDEAVKVWEEGLKIDSSRPDGYQAIGLMALEKGDYEAAISHWRKALEAEPNWPGTRRAIGLALMHMGQIADAVPELEEDLRLSPQSAQTHFLLGDASFQLGKLEEAKRHYESAIQFNPLFSSAHYGLFKTLMRLGQKEAAQEPLNRFKELKAGERKAKREGEEAYDDMIAQRRALARTYDRAGMIYGSYGREDRTAVHFRVAAKLDAINADCRFHLGILHEKRGEIEDAIRMYQETSRLRPEDFRPYLSLGGLYTREGKYPEAEENFKKAMQFSPGHSVGYRELVSLYLGPMAKLNEAEALARRAVYVEPSAANYDLLARACYLNGKLDEAEAAAHQAVDMAPDNQEYRNNYARIRAKR